MADAEAILRAARRPLVIGMGGGGDVVGALAGGREIEGAEPLAPGVLLAGPQTRVRGREVYFAESRMAAFLNRPTVLVTIDHGPSAIADGLAAAVESLRADLLLMIDVGGDVIANGDEPGLRSPLCDAIMLAAAARLAANRVPVLLGIFGAGCDAELTSDEVLERIAEVAAAGGLCGARGLTPPIAKRLERCVQLVPTEASAVAIRAFRGVRGPVPIRAGVRTVDLSTVATTTFYLDVAVTFATVGRLAREVADAETLQDANDALGALGVTTELDIEVERAAGAS